MPLGRLAIKHHPDKSPDPHAAECFKEIANAYRILSDPDLRKTYNEFGPKESIPEGGFVDPKCSVQYLVVIASYRSSVK